MTINDTASLSDRRRNGTDIPVVPALSQIMLLVAALLFITSVDLMGQASVTLRPLVSPGYGNTIGQPAPVPAGRPRIGVVLSGGGGRGLAQIGVLRALEENHIPIDCIVGTSLGSVVAGLYASGYSTTEIESIAVHADWNNLLSFTEETKRTDLFVGQRQAQQEGFLVIRFEGLEPIIPSSISGGQRLSNFFSNLTLQALYHPNPSFDDLKVPYRAIATDLLSGRRVILDHGSLAEAMRASITVPLLYSPLERDSMFLVDGGLTSNIPADVARSLGCDVVIVVNSTSSMRTSDQLEAPWEIADQIMTIMMQEPNGRELKLADVVIAPRGRERIVSDFGGIDTLIAVGESTAMAAVGKIREVIRQCLVGIDLAGVDTTSPVRVRFTGDPLPDTLRDACGFSGPVTSLRLPEITAKLDRISGSGLFGDVSAVIRDSSGKTVLEYHTVRPADIRTLRIRGAHEVKDSLLTARIRTRFGEHFPASRLRDVQECLIRAYRERGYSLARVESLAVDTASGLAELGINEGRIAQIRYEGNLKTRDYVIRREMPFDEGEIFNIDRAVQGIVNIRSTGLFDYVLLDVRSTPSRQPVVVLKVKEKSSELMRLGFQANDEHGLVGTVDIRDGNFRGAWEDFGVLMRYGYRDRGITVGYTVNRIFNTYLTSILSLYARGRDVVTYTDEPQKGSTSWDRLELGRYRESRFGGAMTFGSHLERFGDLTAVLRWEQQHIGSISGEGYAPEDRRLVTLKIQSIVDNLNSYPFPTRGMLLSLSYESAQKPLGSEVGFGKFTGVYETYLTPVRGHTLHPKFTFGFADQTLPTAEEYSLGGLNSFFGLREDDSRGRQLALFNFEYRISLPFKLVFDTYLGLRYDLGTIALVPQELKISNFRHGLGVTLAVDTPVGQASVGAGKSFYSRNDLPGSPTSFGPYLLYFSIGAPLN